jgi:threonine/homoserine/homoserine lactone efflux protein
MLTFAAAVFFLIITPGPGVLSTAGVGAGYGVGPGLRYVGGLFVGNFLVGLAVVSGLAAIALAVPGIREVLLFASGAYLLYLAARIAFAGAKVAFISRSSAPGLWGGVTLQIINPKAYAVNTALFTGFAFLPEASVVEVVVKLVILNLIWIPIHLGWLWAGVSLHRLNLAPRTQRIINIGMALSMLMVVGLAVWAAR